MTPTHPGPAPGLRPPLRPRVLYLEVRGPWPFPLYLLLPLFLWEWALLLALFVLRFRRRFSVPWRAVFALRGLPPTPLWEVEVDGVRVRGGVW
ncbi:hypothetical protein [Thermus filiformis]|jgi:hypothetical protein|uniref:hypothetical protein n=1 Tax=Thermus filiformis TaxID=276 RepID=UPI001F1F519E|nr:hypothetical protein [Thermus filiformis]